MNRYFCKKNLRETHVSKSAHKINLWFWELSPLEEVTAVSPPGVHTSGGLSLGLGAGYIGVFSL